MSGNANPFDMGKMAMGGLGSMLDSVEFLKRAFSSMNLPSTMVPTMDIEELDKRIADLRAVEQWLNVNLSMLQGTIQGLEIQRGTLAAIRAFGESFGAAGTGTGASAGTGAGANPFAPPGGWAAPKAPRASEPAAPPPSEAPSAAGNADPARAPGAGGGSRPSGTSGTSGNAGTASASPAAPPPQGLAGMNPGAWWTLLQQNFNQVAEAALSGAGGLGAAVAAAGGAPSGAGGPATDTPPSTARASTTRRAAAKPSGTGRAPAKPRAPKSATAAPRAPRAPRTPR